MVEILFAEPLGTALVSGLAEALMVAAEAPGDAGESCLLQKPSPGLKVHSSGSSKQRSKDRQQSTGDERLFPGHGQQCNPPRHAPGASRQEPPSSAAELVSCLLALATAHIQVGPSLAVARTSPSAFTELPVPGRQFVHAEGQGVSCRRRMHCMGAEQMSSWDQLAGHPGCSAGTACAEVVAAGLQALRDGLPVPGSAGQQQALEAVTASLRRPFAAQRYLVAGALQAEAAAVVTTEMASIGVLGANQLRPAQQPGTDGSQAGWAPDGAACSVPLLIKAAWIPVSDTEDGAGPQSPSAAAISQLVLQSRGPDMSPDKNAGGTKELAVHSLQRCLNPHSVTADCWPTHAGSPGPLDGRPQLLDCCTAR